MKTTTLGPGGPTLSQFGLGAMSFAGIYGDATQAESADGAALFGLGADRGPGLGDLEIGHDQPAPWVEVPDATPAVAGSLASRSDSR